MSNYPRPDERFQFVSSEVEQLSSGRLVWTKYWEDPATGDTCISRTSNHIDDYQEIHIPNPIERINSD